MTTETFGPKATYVRRLPCLVAGCAERAEAAHVKSRGAGGKADSLVPLCRVHHDEQHVRGVKTFQIERGIDLHAAAAATERLWLVRGTPGDMP